MPIPLSEAVHKLLSGDVLSWPKVGDYKAGNVQLASRGGFYITSCHATGLRLQAPMKICSTG